MPCNNDAQLESDNRRVGLLESLLRGFIKDILWLISAFLVATAFTAAVFWFYGIPVALSIIGGILVLGIALVIRSGGGLFD